jgi:hypothetical protein
LRNLAFILLLIAASAMAQQRPVAVPSDAQVARMTYVEATHSVDLDGVREQLSPGAQIRDQSNRIIVPAAMPPDSVVCYQRDTAGLVHRVWILTPEEAAQRR